MRGDDEEDAGGRRAQGDDHSSSDPSAAPSNPDHLLDDADDGLDDDLLTRDVGGGPLPLDDRLWRHPSELATAGFPASAAPTPTKRARRPSTPAPRQPGYGQRLLAVGLSGAIGALLTAGLLVATGRLSRVDVMAQTTTSTSRAVPVASSSLSPGVASLVAQVQPGVLSVQATKAGSPTLWGSALVMRAGYAITALHIVEGASAIVVHTEGQPRSARMIGADVDTDLALLTIEGAAVQAPPLGSSSALRPGDTAVSVTAGPGPGGEPSVTVGVVSALDRTMTAGKNVLRGVLQIDRPVPPEGAGGALLDATGNVVGITLPAADAATQVGYAIPIDAVSEVSRQLLVSGRVSRPWLGIEGGDVDAYAGASVWQVRPGSPAARAGVQVNDMVTGVDGVPVKTMDDMLRLLRTHSPGDTVRLSILRKDKPTEILVTLAER